ncbi:MAG: class I SAM-dependent methyltransferase [Planctomycetota bacterium]
MSSRWKDAEHVSEYVERRRRPRPFEDETLGLLRQVLRATSRPILRFMDVGCGGGQVGRQVWKVAPDAGGCFADFSAEMLKAARSEMDGIDKEIRFVEADFASPGWVDAVGFLAPFDAIVSGFAIHHVPNDRKKDFYAEAVSLLAPGGAFVTMDWIDSPSEDITHLHNHLYMERCLQMGLFDDSDQTLDEHVDRYANRDDRAGKLLQPLGVQLDWLEDAGLADVDCYFKWLELAVFGGKKPARDE